MANGFDPNSQTWPEYGNYGDNAVFTDPFFGQPQPGAQNPTGNVDQNYGPGSFGGFNTLDDYLNSLGENPGAYGNPIDTATDPNPYWSGLNSPGDVTFGDPSYQIGGDYDPSAIGGYGPGGLYGNPANQVQSPGVAADNPAHGSLGTNNPTVFGGSGGIFDSGIDIGIPGVATIGGIATTLGLGGLLGMDTPGSGLGGPVGVDTGGSGGPLGLGNGGGLLGLGGGALLAGLGLGSGGGMGPVQYPSSTISGAEPVNTPATVLPAVLGSGNNQQQAQAPTVIPPVSSGPIQNANPASAISGDNPGQTPTTVLPPVSGVGNNAVTPQQTTTPTIIPPILNNGGSTISGDHPGTTTPTVLPPVTGGNTSPVQPNNPTTIPVIPIVTPPITGPVGPVGPVGPTTIPTTTTTMPTTLPIDRNYFREGNQTNQDLGALLGGIFGNYAGQSGQYGGADFANFNSLLGGVLGSNNSLTNAANQQTASGNTALRTGNVNDASQLGPQALSLLQQLNPNMYSSLNQANAAAGTAGQPSDIQTMLEQQARAGLGLGQGLSDEELRNAQQSARQAWGARGLINSNGAVGAEILNRDSLGRQRQQERQQFAQGVDATGFSQRQTGLGNMFSNAQLQSQNAFNPFNTITSANTTNTGSNQTLFGQTAGFSSGAFGNQNVNNLVNPFNPYAQDVYSTNFNAGNDRYIAAGNNAAGLAAGQNQSNSALASAFARALGGYLGTLCWTAREVFGEDDPRWMQFREWLLTRAPGWFRSLYIKHGERFAAWLHRNPWAKPPIRAWMESRIRSMDKLAIIEEAA